MCFLAIAQMVLARLNMSVAIVCMVNHTATLSGENGLNRHNHTELYYSGMRIENAIFNVTEANDSTSGQRDSKCGVQRTNTAKERTDGPFVWSKQQQGIILGSYFWGYLLSQIPAGWIVSRFGSIHVLGICTLVSSVICLLTPFLAQYNYIAVIVLRICTGCTAATISPSVVNLLSNWLPPTERARLGAFAYAGYPFGALVSFSGSGLLCKYGFGDGWQSVFYVCGGLGVIFTIAWYLIVSESPERHKRISHAEKIFILNKVEGISKSQKSLSIPWKDIFTSLPVYAILITSFANDFYGTIMYLFLPTYLNDVMGFDISSNGAISSLPYIASSFTIVIFGNISDLILKKAWLSIGQLRKLNSAAGKMVCISTAIAVGFTDCHQVILAIALLITSVAGMGLLTLGYNINPMDIAPAYSGFLVAMTNLVGTVSGIISPYIVTIITGENPSQDSWRIIFLTSAIVIAVSLIFYVIFASGEIQPWAQGSFEIDIVIDVETSMQLENKEDTLSSSLVNRVIKSDEETQSSPDSSLLA